MSRRRHCRPVGPIRRVWHLPDQLGQRSQAVNDTGPNHAFVADYTTYSSARLTSPPVDIVGGIYRLQFRNWYDMEEDWDGGVLEISIDGGAPQDIIAAGGSWVTGGYNRSLLDETAIGGRDAWTGDSGDYIDTIVNLPAAAIGKSVQFHWLSGTDSSVMWTGWTSIRFSCADLW